MGREGGIPMTQKNMISADAPVLVVGATGNLGGEVVKQLLARGRKVRTLVREGTDPARLAAKGVEIARGDLLDRGSLDRAIDGVGTVVTTASGYSRRPGADPSGLVDDLGNHHLADAARNAKIEKFVFTSILACEKAPNAPRVWQKKLIEDYLEASGVPFVSIRPGGLLGGEKPVEMWARDLRKGRLTAIGPANVRWSRILVEDAARILALAIDEPRAVGRRIDIGMDRPFSAEEAAGEFSRALGRFVRLRKLPWPLLNGGAKIAGLVSASVNDLRTTLEHVFSGQFVADTTAQAELFGRPPAIDESFCRYLSHLALGPLACEEPLAVGA
jgi:uncharacterized protein YbjT (DUF2867 family)